MLIRVFVDASPHIPEHRQLPLFTHLISTVGSVQFLHTAVLLLLEKHVVQGANNPDDDKQVRQSIPLSSANVYSLFLAFLFKRVSKKHEEPFLLGFRLDTILKHLSREGTVEMSLLHFSLDNYSI